MRRPRLLDLFCGAGGCAVGYHRAGFDVVGVDTKSQPRYPFAFVRADALEYLAAHGREFDAIHASPPCQGYTAMSNRHRGTGGKADSHARSLPDVFAALGRSGRPYVVENVPGAAREMPCAITLHGGHFGLGVYRPRLFSASFLLMAPTALPPSNPLGVYGARADGRLLWRRGDGTEQRAARSLTDAAAAMGIDWMEWAELSQAIPPAYTEFIGRQLLRALEANP